MRSDLQHIYIVGYGAIGKTLAVFLKISGKQVTIIRGSIAEGKTYSENIRVQMVDGSVYQATIDIMTLQTADDINGIVVMTNKSFGNERLAAALKNKTGKSPVVLLQNGIGVERPFIAWCFPEVYRCVLFVTSQVVDAGIVRFKPVATCPIGVECGSSEMLEEVVSHLNTPYFSFRSDPSIRLVVWKKAIVNCVFNSVCPLLEVDNGIFHREEAALDIAKRIIAECIAIARATGIDLHEEDVEASLVQISRFSDGQEISTLQDIRRGRPTEIETLNYEVVRLAKEVGLENVVRETQLLGELIKIKSDMRLRESLM